MKKLLSLLLAFTFFIALTSCLKTQHSIRVNNQNVRTLNVVIGSDNFGLVGPGVTTSYQNIPVGNTQLSGDLVGSVTVSGIGTHKWTLTITPGGTFDMKEDK